jgi:hypothetical protein
MSEEIPGIALTEEMNNSQKLFVRYLVAVLIDLTVLNLFDEFWALVTVDPFSVSVLAAILLQVLLKATLVLEHKVAAWFNAKSGFSGRRELSMPGSPRSRYRHSSNRFGPKPVRFTDFRNCFGMMASVSTLARSSGATSPR